VAEEAEVALRLADEADLPALAALEAASFPDPWSETLLAGELAAPTSLVLVAFEASAATGYAAFRRAADEAELLRVAVAPAARGRRVALRLVEAGLARLLADGVRSCFLEVRPENRPARALYRALGFRETGRRPRYYADGSDALILRLDLRLDLRRDLPGTREGGSARRAP
jgi:ribosomal-protein-alanine N-acetyltransferase